MLHLKKDKSSKRIKKYKLAKISKDDIIEGIISINEDVKIKNISLFKQSGDDAIYFGGFYRDKKNMTCGTYFGKHDLSSKDANISYNDLPKNIIEEMKDLRDSNYKNISKSGFLNNKDESFTMIFESYDEISRATKDGISTSYVGKDLLICKYQSDGTLLFNECIEKSYPSSTSSPLILGDGEKTYMIFNDRKSKLEKKELEKKGKKKAMSYTDLCIIDGNGKIEKRETLFSSMDVAGWMTPNFYFTNDDNILIFRIIDNKYKKYKMGSLILE